MENSERYSLLALNSFFCLISGFCKNLGSTLPEFAKIYHVSLIEISSGMILRAIGSCLGGAFASYSLEKWNRQLQFSAGVFITGITTVFLPLCLNIKNYYILVTIQSFFLPLDSIVPGVWTAEIFSEKPYFYLLIIDFFSSFGEILTPLFLGFFLSEEVSKDKNLSLINVSFINSEESKLWIPFLVFGSSQIFCSLMFVIAYFIKPYKKVKKTPVIIDTEEEKNEEEDTSSNKNLVLGKNKKKFSRNYIIFFTTMICFIISFQMGNELNCLTFLPSYLTKSTLNLNPKQAAYITIILSLTKAIGRLITSFLTLKINIELMIFFNLIIVFGGNLLLVTLGIKSITITWISLALIGLGLSSTCPLVFCFVQKHVSLKSKYVSFYTIAICLYLSVSSIIIGNLLEKAPNYFIVYNMFTIFLMAMFFIILIVSIKIR